MSTEAITVQSEEVDTVLVTQATNNASVALQIPTFDILGGDRPDLSLGEVLPFDLLDDYWSPQDKGEAKRLIYSHVEKRRFADQQNPDAIIELETAIFFEQANDKSFKQVTNASWRLVKAVSGLPEKTPVLITFMGKTRNKNNSYMSDNWSVKPLLIQLKK